MYKTITDCIGNIVIEIIAMFPNEIREAIWRELLQRLTELVQYMYG